MHSMRLNWCLEHAQLAIVMDSHASISTDLEKAIKQNLDASRPRGYVCRNTIKIHQEAGAACRKDIYCCRIRTPDHFQFMKGLILCLILPQKFFFQERWKRIPHSGGPGECKISQHLLYWRTVVLQVTTATTFHTLSQKSIARMEKHQHYWLCNQISHFQGCIVNEVQNGSFFTNFSPPLTALLCPTWMPYCSGVVPDFTTYSLNIWKGFFL